MTKKINKTLSFFGRLDAKKLNFVIDRKIMYYLAFTKMTSGDLLTIIPTCESDENWKSVI